MCCHRSITRRRLFYAENSIQDQSFADCSNKCAEEEVTDRIKEVAIGLGRLNPQCTIIDRFHPSQNYFLKFLEGLST